MLVALGLGVALLYAYTMAADKGNFALKVCLGCVTFAFFGYALQYPAGQLVPFPSEHVLLCLALLTGGRILSGFKGASASMKIVICLLLIFAINGVAAQYLTRNILAAPKGWVTEAFRATVVPLLVAALINTYVRTKPQIDRCVLFANIGLAAFFLFHYASNLLGFSDEVQESPGQLTTVFERDSMNYIIWATWYGALAAVMLPAPLIKILTGERFSAIYGLTAVVSAIALKLAATRAGILGWSWSIVTALISSKLLLKGTKAYRVLIPLCVMGAFVAAGSLNISHQAMEKLVSATRDGMGEYGFSYRRSLIADSYRGLREHFFGIGFSTLWHTDQTDEANYFVYVANGVGVVGIVSILLVLSYILYRSGRRCLAPGSDYGRRYAVICFILVVTVVITANSSWAIVAESQTSIPIWSIIICCLKAGESDAEELVRGPASRNSALARGFARRVPSGLHAPEA
jgi:hypothetical protein